MEVIGLYWVFKAAAAQRGKRKTDFWGVVHEEMVRWGGILSLAWEGEEAEIEEEDGTGKGTGFVQEHGARGGLEWQGGREESDVAFQDMTWRGKKGGGRKWWWGQRNRLESQVANVFLWHAKEFSICSATTWEILKVFKKESDVIRCII